MADLFSIIKTTEALEKAYVRDSVTAEEYVLSHESELILYLGTSKIVQS